MPSLDARVEVIFRIVLVCGVFLYVGETYDLALLKWASLSGMAVVAAAMALLWRIDRD